MKMKESRVISVLLLLGALFCFNKILFAQGSSFVESPFAESRLWNSEDIEAFYRYMVSRDADPHPDRQMSEETRAKLDEIGRDLESSNVVTRGVYNWFTGLFPAEAESNAEIMRRVAYGILKNWPESRRMMRSILQNYNPVNKQMLFGAPLLKQTWIHWDSQRRRMLEQIEGVGETGAVRRYFEMWKEHWGPDPQADLPAVVPKGYLPEEFDGYWYLSIELETPLVTYYAVFRKKGHIFENWTDSNTEVVSHFMNTSDKPYGPYPVEICFNIPFDGDTIYFTDDYLKIPKKFRWVEPRTWYRVDPRSYTGPAGKEPHVAYDLEYPVMVTSHLDLEYARAVLSSSPGDHFMDVFQKINELKSKGLEIGQEFRRMAGPYNKIQSEMP